MATRQKGLSQEPKPSIQKKPSASATDGSAGVIWHEVKRSRLHGNGVFARRKIPAGTRILEYLGKRITSDEADRAEPSDPDNPFHTFFFMLSSGMIIDGGQQGNDARWINHSCEPNCETEEDDDRVFVVAMRDIARGEELTFDYGLVIDARKTAKLKAQYACLCGTPSCRGTMLALSKRAIREQKKRQKRDQQAT